MPAAGVKGLPSNLTVNALLDLPIQDPHSATQQVVDLLGEDETFGVCSECGASRRSTKCSHCTMVLCSVCGLTHRQLLQIEIKRDLVQIKEGIIKTTTCLQGIKAGSEGITRATEATKRQVCEMIQAFCREMVDRGKLVSNRLDFMLHDKLRGMNNRQEILEMKLVRMESFHNYTLNKLNGPPGLLTDCELADITQQCAQYLGKKEPTDLASAADDTTGARTKRQVQKGKRQSRSRSAGRAVSSMKNRMTQLPSDPEITVESVVPPSTDQDLGRVETQTDSTSQALFSIGARADEVMLQDQPVPCTTSSAVRSSSLGQPSVSATAITTDTPQGLSTTGQACTLITNRAPADGVIERSLVSSPDNDVAMEIQDIQSSPPTESYSEDTRQYLAGPSPAPSGIIVKAIIG